MSGELLSWVGGTLVPAGLARVDPRDRGFTLGDGVFETVRVRHGMPLRWEAHAARLQSGLATLAIPAVYPATRLAEAVDDTLRANALAEAVVRITVSRGVPSRRGLLPDPGSRPTVVIQAEPFAGYPSELYKRGMRLITSAAPRNNLSPLSRIKSLNYLDSVLARAEAAAAGCDEALMLNVARNVACATAANIFAVVRDGIVTPPVSDGALPGTVRGWVLARATGVCGLPAGERSLPAAVLSEAAELFLTNALMGIMPVTSVDGRAVGAGTPGRVAALLQSALDEGDGQPPA